MVLEIEYNIQFTVWQLLNRKLLTNYQLKSFVRKAYLLYPLIFESIWIFSMAPLLSVGSLVNSPTQSLRFDLGAFLQWISIFLWECLSANEETVNQTWVWTWPNKINRLIVQKNVYLTSMLFCYTICKSIAKENKENNKYWETIHYRVSSFLLIFSRERKAIMKRMRIICNSIILVNIFSICKDLVNFWLTINLQNQLMIE